MKIWKQLEILNIIVIQNSRDTLEIMFQFFFLWWKFIYQITQKFDIPLNGHLSDKNKYIYKNTHSVCL